jgi:hypothetical protein
VRIDKLTKDSLASSSSRSQPDQDGKARRLPMTPMELVTVVGPKGPVPLQEVFEDRRMRIAFTSGGP